MIEFWEDYLLASSARTFNAATVENLHSFVYHRELGLIPVDECGHDTFMSFLYTWEYHPESIWLDGCADKYIQKSGTFYRSSCSVKICVALLGNLNFQEKQYLIELTMST